MESSVDWILDEGSAAGKAVKQWHQVRPADYFSLRILKHLLMFWELFVTLGHNMQKEMQNVLMVQKYIFFSPAHDGEEENECILNAPE